MAQTSCNLERQLDEVKRLSELSLKQELQKQCAGYGKGAAAQIYLTTYSIHRLKLTKLSFASGGYPPSAKVKTRKLNDKIEMSSR
jgi:hypothetical protein